MFNLTLFYLVPDLLSREKEENHKQSFFDSNGSPGYVGMGVVTTTWYTIVQASQKRPLIYLVHRSVLWENTGRCEIKDGVPQATGEWVQTGLGHKELFQRS